MNNSIITELRRSYHKRVGQEIIRITAKGERGYPNFADGSSAASIDIAWGLFERLECEAGVDRLVGQTTGTRFEVVTRQFLEVCFTRLRHLRPGTWHFNTLTDISQFDQYEHLSYLSAVVSLDKKLEAALGGDYIIRPDIIVARTPVDDDEINKNENLIFPTDLIASRTPLRAVNYPSSHLILHASISCKWTIRSDRAQNTRAEALNLVRNRKGHLPHVVAVTAEPLPTRLAALALGTGDLDCVYHFALAELRDSVEACGSDEQLEMLDVMIEGRRLRDISDLPFDLAI